MDEKHMITRQGKTYVLYAGLLDAAHRQGLKRISTRILQLPTAANANMAIVRAEVETDKGIFSGLGDANMAIVRAEVETDKGIFSGLGDASPQNVGSMIVPHIIRMAETRGKARALRDATNVLGEPMEDFIAEEPDMPPAPQAEPEAVEAMPRPEANTATRGTVHAGGKTPATPPPAAHALVGQTRDPRDALSLLANELARRTDKSLDRVLRAVAVKCGIRFTKTADLSDDEATKMGREVRASLDAITAADAENAAAS